MSFGSSAPESQQSDRLPRLDLSPLGFVRYAGWMVWRAFITRAVALLIMTWRHSDRFVRCVKKPPHPLPQNVEA